MTPTPPGLAVLLQPVKGPRAVVPGKAAPSSLSPMGPLGALLHPDSFAPEHHSPGWPYAAPGSWMTAVRTLCSFPAGTAPAQAAPDLGSALESLPGKLKEFGSTVESKARAAIEHIKQSDFPTKTWSGPF